MYESLKPFVNVPFQYRPFIKYNGAGTAQYGESVNSLCYPVGDIKVVTNEDGVEVTSSTQLYIDGSEPLKVRDKLTFNEESRKIIRINEFYRDGTVDVKVVYL